MKSNPFVKCPFCGEDDFDLPGLKSHLSRGDCEAYEDTENIKTSWDRIREAREKLAAGDQEGHKP